MRKLLVTGSSGLIGSRVVALAAQSGFEIVPLHRGGGADICDAHSLQGAVAAVADAAALVHLAAFTDVSAAHQQDGDKHGACFQVNVCGTENVAAACRAASLPWVHVSTDFVFGGGKVEPYTEADTPDPIEWYGRTKLDAEHVARDAGATIARVSFPYSVPPAPKPDLVRWVVGALRDGKELRLFDDQYITPTFVDDIATALLILADTPVDQLPSGALFHVSGGEWTTPFDLGQQAAAVFDCDASLLHPAALSDFLEQDPRPRQRALRVSNAHWTRWLTEHGHESPRGIAAGLAAVRAAEKQ